jgi:NhaA family Na+:H+ antiporter
MAIPIQTRINAAEYSAQARELLDAFDRTETGDLLVLNSRGQQEAIFAIGRANLHVLAPLLRLEHALHGLSAFVVMPLFAFSNAGVTLSGLSVDRVTLAVFLGLALGKPLGITGAAFVAVRTGLAGLPQGVRWGAMHGCGWLGGIGFTMALFIATLAFEGTPLLESAKVGILTASAVAGIVGAAILRAGFRRERDLSR